MYDGQNFIGNLYFGSEGYMTVDSNGFRVYKGEKHEKVMDEKYTEPAVWDPGPHMRNFLTAVRSRKTSDLNAPLQEGVASAALCHLANISYRTGRKLNVDAKSWRLVDDEAANRLLTREYRAPYVVPERV